jgi:hypothetical protein
VLPNRQARQRPQHAGLGGIDLVGRGVALFGGRQIPAPFGKAAQQPLQSRDVLLPLGFAQLLDQLTEGELALVHATAGDQGAAQVLLDRQIARRHLGQTLEGATASPGLPSGPRYSDATSDRIAFCLVSSFSRLSRAKSCATSCLWLPVLRASPSRAVMAGSHVGSLARATSYSAHEVIGFGPVAAWMAARRQSTSALSWARSRHPLPFQSLACLLPTLLFSWMRATAISDEKCSGSLASTACRASSALSSAPSFSPQMAATCTR